MHLYRVQALKEEFSNEKMPKWEIDKNVLRKSHILYTFPLQSLPTLEIFKSTVP
jgi:hypothetical protein